MPTPSEQKALAFVAFVILVGGAARVVRAGAAPVPTPLEQQALARQASATDSAARAALPKSGKRKKVSLRVSKDTVPKVIGGVATVPVNRLGFPPPGPAIVSHGSPLPPSMSPLKSKAGPVNVDVAAATEIETLPRIGPALAKRIVANRDSFGPFRSLEGLGRVKGVGKATLEKLAPFVSFGSGP